ncbi:hypothetical protein LUZ60_011116 [Juncus effusus]|nr:hypothetical protein LUZ60_011116 [Juncus effusus]
MEHLKYEEEFISNSRGIRLFTCKWLPLETKPKALIFLLHGVAAECSVSLQGTAIKLVQAGYAVYGIDYEGHGKSDGTKGYISNFDHLVSDCSDHFKNICEKEENKNKKRFLFGFSMGGAVAINMNKKDPLFWNGAVLLAPMCKISDEMMPGPFLISALKILCKIAPKWKILPSTDMLDKVIKNSQIREEVRSNPYMYKDSLPLNTAHELLMASIQIEKTLNQVSFPFLVMHGGADVVTDPLVSKMLYESASSNDKTLKVYPGFLHAITAEEPQDSELVFSDFISWLDQRS